MSPRSTLLIVLTVYVVFGTAFNWITPLGEGPDEPSHFHYIQYLARTWRLPVLRPGAEDNVTAEAYQPPLYYLLGALLTYPWVRSEAALDFRPRQPGEAKRPIFEHAPEAAFPWSGGTAAWHLLRFYSLALGLVTLYCVHRGCRILHGQEWPAVVAVGYLALNPQFIYIHSLVTNDALATAAGSLLLLFIVDRSVAKRPVDPIRAGLLITLAVLTKSSVALLCGGLALLFLRDWRKPGTRRAASIKRILICATIPAVLAGWWFIRNWMLYGDLLGISASMQNVSANHYPKPLTPLQFLRILPKVVLWTFRSSWGLFGWVGFELARRVYNAIAIGHLIAWGRLLVALRPSHLRAWVLPSLLASGVTLWLGFCHYNTFTNQAGWQGRLLFPASFLFALAFVEGWRRILPRPAFLLPAAALCAEGLLLLYAFFRVVAPIYSPA